MAVKQVQEFDRSSTLAIFLITSFFFHNFVGKQIMFCKLNNMESSALLVRHISSYLSELSTFSLSSLLNFLYFVQAMVCTEEAMELTVAMVGMEWG